MFTGTWNDRAKVDQSNGTPPNFTHMHNTCDGNISYTFTATCPVKSTSKLSAFPIISAAFQYLSLLMKLYLLSCSRCIRSTNKQTQRYNVLWSQDKRKQKNGGCSSYKWTDSEDSNHSYTTWFSAHNTLTTGTTKGQNAGKGKSVVWKVDG